MSEARPTDAAERQLRSFARLAKETLEATDRHHAIGNKTSKTYFDDYRKKFLQACAAILKPADEPGLF